MSPLQPIGSMICQDSEYSHNHGCDLLYRKDREQNQQRKKVYGEKSRENQAQAFKSLSHWYHTGQVVTTCWKCCLPEKPIRDSISRGSYEVLIMQEPSAWHVPNFQTPRSKAGIQHKPHSCTNCLGTVSHSHQLRVVRTLPKSTFSEAR